ncbi:hypothetical protein ACTI_79560 [Actinoplanes sp. OR16]|nr:hypothetical protein ACTI_79560 [Actinoplanes sp. OR16]
MTVALRRVGLERAHVTVVATLDQREPMMREVAAFFGWETRGFPAAVLAGVRVPTPSAVVAAAVGTPGVAEAAALLAAGPGSSLVLTKTIVGPVTVAVGADVTSAPFSER